MTKKIISPSLICTNLCNIQSDVKRLENLGAKFLHVDIIDGIYAPDMPLGINTIKQLRKCTDLVLDAHLMSVNNQPYVDLLIQAGVDRLCFQTEFEKRPNVLLKKIRLAGIKAGIAIAPETPICMILPLLTLCDFVLLMRIDAGYAHLSGQSTYDYVDDKIKQLKNYIDEQSLQVEIEVDGRVGIQDMKKLSILGANIFVSGSQGLFAQQNSWEQNWKLLEATLNE